MNDKLKLTPEAKRTFLELGAKYVEEKTKNVAKFDTVIQLVSDFIKKTAVSKAYWVSSRIVRNDIYRVNLVFSGKTNGFMITHKGYASEHENHIVVSFEFARMLLNFLKPAYVEIKVIKDHGFVDAREFLDMLENTGTKVSLNILPCFSKIRARALLDYYAHMLDQFSCGIKLLLTEKMFGFGKLNVFKVYDTLSIGQLVYVLKYGVKKICLEGSFQLSYMDVKEVLEKDKYWAIEAIRVDFGIVGRTAFWKFGEFVTTVRKCCPGLKQLDIKLSFQFGRNRRTFYQIQSYTQYMKDLAALVSDSLIKCNIIFHTSFYTDKVPSRQMQAQILDNKDFSGWNFSKRTEQLDRFAYRDIMEMAFNGDNCTLKFEAPEVVDPKHSHLWD